MGTLNGVSYEEGLGCAQCAAQAGRPTFLPGDWNRKVTVLCGPCSTKPANQSAAGTMCHAHFDRDRTLDHMSMADVLACPDCQAAGQARSERIQREDTIDPDQPFGEHIALTCRNHPDLRWHTKNISCIGARSIFFADANTRLNECTCPLSDLIVLKEVK